jgi:hypothetical protein
LSYDIQRNKPGQTREIEEEETMGVQYPYIVIDAPGFYGHLGRVWSRHRTLAAARKAARKHRADLPGQGIVSLARVAHNQGYRAGDKFWADMPPEIITDDADDDR